MRSVLTLLALLCGLSIMAQDELVAYVPRKHIDRTADAESISLTTTTSPGIYELRVPVGTYFIDVLDSRGTPLADQPMTEDGAIDIRALRASTYTIRAHTPDGIRIKRFALMGSGASLWAIDAEPVR